MGGSLMFKDLSNAVRFLSASIVDNANSGHLGMPLGMADALTVLFKDFLKFDALNPNWPNRDRLIFSGGHGAPALYALLYLSGYEKITLDRLKQCRKLGSITTGHPEYNPEAGIEFTTGLLGQGVANAVGAAIAERMLNSRLGSDIIDYYTYVIAGDGDLMEGISHEACSLAGRLSLGHLIVLFDDNNVTIDGKVSITCREDVLKRFESYGWQTLAVDGHCEYSLSEAIKEAKTSLCPTIIACRTKIGFATPREGLSSAHSGSLSKEEWDYMAEKLNWNSLPFEIPEYILSTWRVIGKKHHDECEKWKKNKSFKYGAEKFEISDEIKKTFRTLKKEVFVSRPFCATRATAKGVITCLTQVCGDIVSGSADLGSSTGCFSNVMTPITAKNFSGDYIHYGIREHAMAAIMNGIAASKKIHPFGGTFLVFSDYMKPAIRMSALMNLPVTYIFSHDSIGVGEDGATHQPVEHLASLRSIPNLLVFRPSDATETIECFELALKLNRPCAIVLTRQNVLNVRFSSDENLCSRGGYSLNEDKLDKNTDVTIIATGSEVDLALETKKLLNNDNISVNILSLVCWEIFDDQPEEYRNFVLGSGLRVGLEASNGFGWEKYLNNGLFFGVKNFGKSCSCSENYKFFNLTSHNICLAIKNKLKKY